MEWLIILALLGWVWRQSYRIGKLERRLEALDADARTRAAAMPAPVAEPQPPQPEAPPAVPVTPPAPEPAKPALTLVTPPAPAEQEPLILDKPLPPDTREPLLLDTPLPPEDQMPLVIPEAARPAPIVRAPTPPKQPKPKGERRFEKWLAENGFAWAGGALVAFGVIFFLSYASRQGWFTPQLRLLLATIFGAALVGASEYARQIGIKKPPGHPLVASMLAGAGVVAFYGTVLAALGYGFISYSVAALLLTVCALILFGLSFLHGQAIGVLALGAALLAPALSNLGAWPSWAATLYIVAVAIGGFAIAWVRRWAWVAIATVSGLYFWYAAALSAEDVRRATALLAIATFGAIFVGLRKPLADEATGRVPWSRAQSLGPSIIVCVSSILAIWVWLVLVPKPSGGISACAGLAIFHVALASAAVRARVAAPAGLAIAIGALVFGFLAYLRAKFYFPPLGPDYYPWILFASLVVAVAALGARPHRTSRVLIAASGAIGSALLVTLAAFSREHAWHTVQAWGPLFIGAALLFAAAWHTARDVAEPTTDSAVTFWAGSGAALVLIGVESISPPEWRAALHAFAALLFSVGFALRGWRILGHASLTAAAITIAHSLSASLLGAALAGTLGVQAALLILVAAAAFLYGASTFAMQRGHTSATVESLSSASIIVALIALFLGLRWIAMGGIGTPLDAFTEAALRALTLLAAGHVTMTTPKDTAGAIARWRGPVLMVLGFLVGVVTTGMMLNPWWGFSPAVPLGAPIFNAQLIAYAAPAGVLFLAASRQYDHDRWAARLYAGAGGLFALIWAVLEVRRAFHFPYMADGAIGLLEGACYGLLALAGALAVAITARMRAAKDATRPFTHDLQLITRGCAWAGILFAAWFLLVYRHPWWGAQLGGETTTLTTGLAVFAQLVAVVLALVLGRALSNSMAVIRTRFLAASAAVVFAWSFGHCAIRWFHQFGAMDDGTGLVGLEGFGHAIWPLLLVVIGSEITARAPGRDTVRAYLYDLQAIWSSAVWPAAGFAALWLWLLFNPWWGMAPAPAPNLFTAILVVATFVFAAWLTMYATGTPFLRWARRFERAAEVAAIAHLFDAVTFAVRWGYHGGAMAHAPTTDAEMWTYSAVWAAFAAGAFWLGLKRNDAILRWAGLAILVATTGKVFLIDITGGVVIRVASTIGLGLVLLGIAWLARRFAQPTPPLGPDDMAKITPSARRERRRDRR